MDYQELYNTAIGVVLVLLGWAILGTDYDYDFPEINKVRITSKTHQNLKVRVV